MSAATNKPLTWLRSRPGILAGIQLEEQDVFRYGDVFFPAGDGRRSVWLDLRIGRAKGGSNKADLDPAVHVIALMHPATLAEARRVTG
jgi:hypothetical protein